MDPRIEAQRAQKDWEQKMGIGTLDKMFDVIQGKLPNYNEIDDLGATKPEEHHLGDDDLLRVITKTGMSNSSVEKTGADITIENLSIRTLDEPLGLTDLQIKAAQKYPSLVEMLGRDDVDELAQKIGELFNSHIMSKITGNSSLINKNAIDCKQEQKSIKQYFQYKDRAGFVRVSGKFVGDEFIHYDFGQNKGLILRRKNGNQFANVSREFEVEAEFVEI